MALKQRITHSYFSPLFELLSSCESEDETEQLLFIKNHFLENHGHLLQNYCSKANQDCEREEEDEEKVNQEKGYPQQLSFLLLVLNRLDSNFLLQIMSPPQEKDSTFSIPISPSLSEMRWLFYSLTKVLEKIIDQEESEIQKEDDQKNLENDCNCFLLLLQKILSLPLSFPQYSIDEVCDDEHMYSLVESAVQLTESDSPIFEEILSYIVILNKHYEDMNKNKIFQHLSDKRTHSNTIVLSSHFISLLNRAEEDLRLECLKFFHNIFEYNDLCTSFFYLNDLKVLIDILIRLINDFDNDPQITSECIETFESILRNNAEYRSETYRKKETKELLQSIIDSDQDNYTFSQISLTLFLENKTKAKKLLESNLLN